MTHLNIYLPNTHRDLLVEMIEARIEANNEYIVDMETGREPSHTLDEIRSENEILKDMLALFQP